MNSCFRNIELSVNITGSQTEEGFLKVPLQMEAEFGKGCFVGLVMKSPQFEFITTLQGWIAEHQIQSKLILNICFNFITSSSFNCVNF